MKPKIIKSWEDLAQLPDSATHRLHGADGWLVRKRLLRAENTNIFRRILFTNCITNKPRRN